MKKFLYLIIAIIIVGIGVITTVNLNKDSNNETENNNDLKDTTEEDLSCKYTEKDLEHYAILYFTSKNGEKAENGEDFIVGSEILDNSYIVVTISHLQVDHSTVDARYTIDCKTGVGTDDSDNTIDFINN